MLRMSHAIHVRLRDSLIPASINALVNGAIAKWKFGEEESVPLSLDLISTQQHTVWGEGATLAFALGVILTLITAKLFERHVLKADASLAVLVQRPIFPHVLAMALDNAVILFGWFVALAVLWHRLMGPVEVTALSASVLVGLLAGGITLVVEVRTKKALLRSP